MKKTKKSFVKISLFTYLFALLWFFMGNGAMFVFYFLALILHELAHAVIANKLGYGMEKIVISPMGATLYANTDEFTSKDEVKIALAGPICSFLLSIFCVCVWWIFPESYNYTMDFCMANFSIFLLNILPIYPLDGGRVLSAVMTKNMSRKNVARVQFIISFVFGAALIFMTIISIFYTFNYTFGMVGCFLIISTVSGNRENAYKKEKSLPIKQKKLNKGLIQKTIIVPSSMQIVKVYSLIDISAYFVIDVVDNCFNKIFSINESEFSSVLKMYSLDTQIGDIRIDKLVVDW